LVYVRICFAVVLFFAEIIILLSNFSCNFTFRFLFLFLVVIFLFKLQRVKLSCPIALLKSFLFNNNKQNLLKNSSYFSLF
jgi:hypothetical protein